MFSSQNTPKYSSARFRDTMTVLGRFRSGFTDVHNVQCRVHCDNTFREREAVIMHPCHCAYRARKWLIMCSLEYFKK